MVARIRSISSAGNASKYFYFTEKNYECAKGWHENKETKELGDKLTKESFENALNGNIKEGVELGRKTKDGSTAFLVDNWRALQRCIIWGIKVNSWSF